MSVIKHFENLIARLPTGRAWRGKGQRSILKVIADKIKEITDELLIIRNVELFLVRETDDITFTLGNDIHSLGSEGAILGIRTTSDRQLSIWEYILSLLGQGTNEERLEAIVQALTTAGKISKSALEIVLQANGFDVYVHSNDGKITASDVVTLGYGSTLFGTLEDGTDVRLAIDTDGNSDPDIPGSELCVNFIDSTIDESKYRTKLTTDQRRWEYCFFIGGETFPDFAGVYANRKEEFRELILKSKPAGMWAVLLVNYE